MQRSRGWFTAALGAALTLACAKPPAPEGAFLSARTADLSLLLARLARLEGTPLGDGAAALAARLPACPAVEARTAEPDLAALLAALRCSDPPEAAGRPGIRFVWPLAQGEPVRGRISLDPSANAELELELPASLADGAAGLALPGAEPPGPGVLSSAETLLHARVRSAGGIDLARLLAADSQASQMFRLKSRLFAGAVLDGTWEAAVYLPGEHDAVPPAALALGFTARAPAIAAMEQFLDELRETWPISRREFSLGKATGACLPDLHILPDFAPCYVATQHALIVGWNAASVARSVRADGSRLGAQGGLVVEFARFAEADARIAAHERAPAPAPATAPPWHRLRAVGRTEADGVRLHVQLQAERDA